ncbi:MAG TPA: hypothetical protein PLA65_19960 [Spirochaetota bacterium]|nr:hypothetical protein [Spirochaetota bacterium]
MKLVKKIAFFLPVMAMIVVINYIIDPANLYHDHEARIAGLLVEGKDVAIPKGFNEGEILIHYLNNIKKNFDIIVLGSSRAMPISSASFRGKTLHNLSVSSASVQNLQTIYELMQKNKIQCETMVMALDPWLIIGGHVAPHPDLDLLYYKNRDKKQYYCSMMKRYYDILAELISFSYFQSSIKALFPSRGCGGMTYHEAKNDGVVDDINVLLSDGSRKWKRSFNKTSTAQARDEAVKYINNGLKVYSVAPFNDVMKEEIEQLFRRIKHSGVDMVFWFPPYHPAVFKKIVSDCPIIIQSEEYFRDVARKNSMRTYGSYDPGKSGFREEDFFDHHHLKNDPMRRHMMNMAQALKL